MYSFSQIYRFGTDVTHAWSLTSSIRKNSHGIMFGNCCGQGILPSRPIHRFENDSLADHTQMLPNVEVPQPDDQTHMYGLLNLNLK